MRIGSARKAFTLVELLVVIGIIAVIGAIAIPALNSARISADITAQKADFQTIAQAIANYKSDFGVIPMNISQNQAAHNPNPPPTSPPIRLMTLASALIGPGPAVMTSSPQQVPTPPSPVQYVVAGDGADGLGFRASAVPYPTQLSTSVGAGATTVTVQTLPPTWAWPGSPSGYAWPGSAAAPVPIYITFSPGAPNATNRTNFEESVGIATTYTSSTIGAPGNGGSPVTTFQLLSPTQYSHTDTIAIIRTCSGKVWGPYLNPDKFKVKYNYSQEPAAAPYVPIWPELVDRWNNPILYFTRYYPNSNRLADSCIGSTATASVSGAAPVLAGNATLKYGPLLGISTPHSVEANPETRGGFVDPLPDNAIWDLRDAGWNWNTASAVYTTYMQTNPVDYAMTIRWMLGDNPTAANYGNAFTLPNLGNDNFIDSTETAYEGEFFMVSVGPINDGYGMPGGLCNFLNSPNPTSPTIHLGIPGRLWQQTFNASGNVYSFDKPD